MPKMRYPSSNELRRAIAIDFEGNEKLSPTLLGVAVEGEWSANVLEDQFESTVAYGVQNGTITYAPLLEALEHVRQRAMRERRLVVAWSNHEIETILFHIQSRRQRIWWQTHLINGLLIAKRWRKATGVTIEPIETGKYVNRNPLRSYMNAVGYPVPATDRLGQTGQRLRLVRSQLKQRGDFAKLTPVQKGKWTKVLTHNRHDCLGLLAVMTSVADIAKESAAKKEKHPWGREVIDRSLYEDVESNRSYCKIVRHNYPDAIERFRAVWCNRDLFFMPSLTTKGWCVSLEFWIDSPMYDGPQFFSFVGSMHDAIVKSAVANWTIGLQPRHMHMNRERQTSEGRNI